MKKIKLTKLDRKLLYELDMNARASLQQLAKKSSASKERIHYRIKRLEREGVITNYRTIINTNRLGYTSFRIFLKLRNTDLAKEKEIIEHIKTNAHVCWLVTVEGYWNLNMWLLIKESETFTTFLKELEKGFKHNIDRMKIAIFESIIQYPKNFLLEKERDEEKGMAFVSPTKQVEYDSKDIKILQALSENARSPLVKIATIVEMSVKQVHTRLRALEKKEIILGYRANIDHRRMGYSYYKLHFWLKDWSQELVDKILNYAKQHKNLFYIDKMLNGADVELEFLTEDKEAMQQIIEEFREHFTEDISKYELQEYPKEHKLIFLPEIER